MLTERALSAFSSSKVLRGVLYSRSLKRSFAELISDYWILTKPGITLAVLMTTTAGFVLGSIGNRIDWTTLFHTLLGTALISAGSGTLNMLLEVESDSLMDRTKNRPIPAGRIRPEEAFLFGTLGASIGIVHIAAMVNLSASFIAMVGLTLYLVFYTPMKKSTYFCIVVGSISGAIPPLIGWSASRGSPSLAGWGGWGGWSLFLILFVWQIPHLLALSWIYRQDYARAKFKMFLLDDPTGLVTARIAFFFSLFLLPSSFVPYWMGLSGAIYFYSAIILGSVFVGVSFYFLVKKSYLSAKLLFVTSVLYLPLIFLLMVVGKGK